METVSGKASTVDKKDGVKESKEGNKLHQHQMDAKSDNTNKVKHLNASFSLFKIYFFH